MPLLKPIDFTTNLSLEELFHGLLVQWVIITFCVLLVSHLSHLAAEFQWTCASFPLSQSAINFPVLLLTKNSASIVSMISSNFLFCSAMTKLSHRLRVLFYLVCWLNCCVSFGTKIGKLYLKLRYRWGAVGREKKIWSSEKYNVWESNKSGWGTWSFDFRSWNVGGTTVPDKKPQL